MKRFLLFFFGGLVSLFVQGALFPLIPKLHIGPDLILVITIYCAFHMTPIYGASLVFLLGLMVDAHAGTLPMGLHSLILTTVFVLWSQIVPMLYSKGRYLESFVAFSSSLFKGIVIAAVIQLLDRRGGQLSVVLPRICFQAFLTALVCQPFMFLIGKIEGVLLRPFAPWGEGHKR